MSRDYNVTVSGKTWQTFCHPQQRKVLITCSCFIYKQRDQIKIKVLKSIEWLLWSCIFNIFLEKLHKKLQISKTLL